MISQILSNRYRIVNEVGSGGMAKVYQAEDLNSGQLVAVKVMYPQFSEDSSYVQRFVREAKLAELLDSPHIVKILDYGSSRDTHYLVMEYVEGESLRDVLSKRGPIPWEEALAMVDQIGRALETANEHNIVHRDIKPQNLMLTEAGLLKVLDFGIARARMLPSLTQSGFVGSPYYIAPEQAMGEEVDIRSDIYSTGIVLYELLNGKVPFDAKSPWSIISKHITADLPQLNIDEIVVPEGVQLLLKHMVAKRPDDRIQDPKTLRQTIGALQAGGDFPRHLMAADLTNTAGEDEIDAAEKATSIYERAEAAIAAESWQEALGLLNQVLDLDPVHPKAANHRRKVGQMARLSALYQAAGRALDAGRWQEAIDELTEITKLDESFADTATLLEQAHQALQKQAAGELPAIDTVDSEQASGDADPSANTLVDQHKMDTMRGKIEAIPRPAPAKNVAHNASTVVEADTAISKSSMTWLLAPVVVILLILAGVWAVNQNQTVEADPPAEAINERIAEAESALAEGDYQISSQLVSEVLKDDPTNRAAQVLKEEVDRFLAWDAQLVAAQAAIADKSWTTAIDTLEALSQSAEFKPDLVKKTLCDAFLQRGQGRLDQITNPRDKATVEAALLDFQDGSKLCPDNGQLESEIARANTYLTIFAPDSTVNSVIEEIGALTEEVPMYAGGQALQNLYEAYLSRGDILRLQADLAAAIEDYDAALALDVPDLSKARLKKEAALDALSQANPARPAEVNTDFRRGPTALSGPEVGSEYEGRFTEITLQWEAVPLAEDEYFDVTVRWFIGDEPRYWGGNSLSLEGGVRCDDICLWRVPVEAGYGQAANDKYDWWVTIRQRSTDRALSPASEEWYYIWREG